MPGWLRRIDYLQPIPEYIRYTLNDPIQGRAARLSPGGLPQVACVLGCSEESGENLTPPAGRSLRFLSRLAGQPFAEKIPPGAGRVILAADPPG